MDDHSSEFLDQSGRINVCLILCAIVIGLVGNFLTIFVFSHKRFRNNSSNIYLLCLACIDSLFLVLHLFEDTVRTFKDIFMSEDYLNDNSTQILTSIVYIFNIIDRFDFTCRLINYLRYFLRFVSAYIIVAFTVQRLILINSPFSDRFKSKKSAWKTFLVITLISCFINLWVPFLFKIQQTEQDNIQYCDVEKAWKNQYFYITIVYTTLIMLVPIITIFCCNSIIIFKTKKAEAIRKNLQLSQVVRKEVSTRKNSRTRTKDTFRLRPYYVTCDKQAHNLHFKDESSKKLTQILFMISFSYALLNLPYLITWYVFFYQIQFNSIDESNRNYLFGAVQLSEIFYVLNYGLKFYIYCASGSIFRRQLKYSSHLSNRPTKQVMYYLEKC